MELYIRFLNILEIPIILYDHHCISYLAIEIGDFENKNVAPPFGILELL